MKIYYAHSMKKYFTEDEKQEEEFIKKTFKDCKVINPNNIRPGVRGLVMQPYLNEIVNCDLVICSEYKKTIGKGVYAEIKHALYLGKKVYVLREKKLLPVKDLRIKNDDDWAVGFGEIMV